MPGSGDNFIRRTGKSLSILAFETTKQSRMIKKRMRITALQKEIKADLRDLGRLVYDAYKRNITDILNDPEVKNLFGNITKTNDEIERLRESIDRISRVKKTFDTFLEEEALPLLLEAPSDEAPKPAPKKQGLREKIKSKVKAAKEKRAQTKAAKATPPVSGKPSSKSAKKPKSKLTRGKSLKAKA